MEREMRVWSEEVDVKARKRHESVLIHSEKVNCLLSLCWYYCCKISRNNGSNSSNIFYIRFVPKSCFCGWHVGQIWVTTVCDWERQWSFHCMLMERDEMKSYSIPNHQGPSAWPFVICFKLFNHKFRSFKMIAV